MTELLFWFTGFTAGAASVATLGALVAVGSTRKAGQ